MAKRKERPLTIEEIKAKVKAETLTRWLHSPPLFGLVPTATGNQFLSLSEVIETQTTVVFLLDVGDYTTERVFEILDLWRVRYRKLNWNPVVVFQQKYLFLKNAKFFDQFKTYACYSTLPILLDPFGDFHEKYGSSREPVALVFKNAELATSISLREDFPSKLLQIEKQLHTCLTQDDPGLPLPILKPYTVTGNTDIKATTANDTTHSGEWIESSASATTSDPLATLTIPFEGKVLRLIAVLHSNAHENCKVTVTLDQGALPNSILGKDVKTDDKGNSTLEINRASGTYEIIQSENQMRGILKFSSVQFIENPVIFYEFRAGINSA